MSQKLVIRSKSFRAWFNRHISKDNCRCICEYGASYGPPKMIHYHETNAIYDRFEVEVWKLALFGNQTVADLRDKDALSDPVRFKNAMVWAAAETLAASRGQTYQWKSIALIPENCRPSDSAPVHLTSGGCFEKP